MKKCDKKSKMYVNILSIQDLIRKLVIKRSVLLLGKMKRVLHLTV